MDKALTVGYLRVSTDRQTLDNQKLVILDYAQKHKLTIDYFVSLTISSRRSIAERKLSATIEQLTNGDQLIVTELSRLGRSTVEVLSLVEKIIQKGITLILIKENLQLTKHNHEDMTNTVMLWVFSLLANLERNLISQRTKEGLAQRKQAGITLGKPKGSIQKSIYDEQLPLIQQYLAKQIDLRNIQRLLGMGTYRGLYAYVQRRKLKGF